MSLVSISDITVLSNPARFADPYLFRITFECISPLDDGAFRQAAFPRMPRFRATQVDDLIGGPDIEWKLIYVGSAESTSFDQELDTCMVGPVPVGINTFEFEVGQSIRQIKAASATTYLPLFAMLGSSALAKRHSVIRSSRSYCHPSYSFLRRTGVCPHRLLCQHRIRR